MQRPTLKTHFKHGGANVRNNVLPRAFAAGPLRAALLAVGMAFLTGCNRIYPMISLRGTPPSQTMASTKPLVFIMAGQSNMSGVTTQYPGPWPVSPRITWVHDPGDGPIVSFATSLIAKNSSSQVVIVNCSKWGSFIQKWQPGQPNYETCMQDAKQAIKDSTGTLAGFIWDQGEADTQYPVDPQASDDWARDFQSIISGVRSTFHFPVPVVFVQLAYYTGNQAQHPAWQAVKDAQGSFSCPGCVMVKTDGVSLQDTVHYDAASFDMMGKRLADAWYALSLGE